MRRPNENEYPEYYKHYINLVTGNSAVKYLESQILDLQSFIYDIEEHENFTYSPGKWTIKEVMGHITDAERVFGYRAMRFARGDENPLPGFDENAYVSAANFGNRTLRDIAHEFSMMRHSNIHLFKSFTETELDKIGIANNNKISVRALIFAIGGHVEHHINVVRTRYLNQFPS